MKLVPMIGSPPMPTAVDWPEARLGERVDDLIGQRAGAGDEPDPARLVDEAGHDADLALAWRDQAGAVRADQARALALARSRRPGPCRSPAYPR